MKKRLYTLHGFDSEICYERDYWEGILKDDLHHNWYKLGVWEANIPGDGTFFCIEDGEAYDSSESYCGLQCSGYKPRNGKSGRCKWHGPTYSPTGETIRIEK